MNRVSVIEVGSRAVRLLVADLSADSKLQVVGTDWKETGLAEGLDTGVEEAAAKIDQVRDVLARFCERAREFQATRIAAFGTEAIRRMGPNAVNHLREVCPDFRVLTRKEEAELSFLTAVMGLPPDSMVQDRHLVIDQGSGSMEVIVGTMSSAGAKITDSRSYKLGTRELVKLLHEKGRLLDLRRVLVARFSQHKRLTELSTGRPIILGSAATKIAWLSVRREPMAQYDPRQVHGRVIRLRDLDSLVRVAEADPATARLLIDPRKPESSEFETVITGLVALEVFLRREKKEDFVVCGHGTRYGFAWKLSFADGRP